MFGDNVKLIKYDYANSTMLGTNGDYYNNYSENTGFLWDTNYYKGTQNTALIGTYYWNNENGSDSTNIWNTSSLNIMNLNTNYISYLNNQNAKWVSMIDESIVWKIGGMMESSVYGSSVKTAYINELGSASSSTTLNTKIGLMYVSDYGYAADPSGWLNDLYNDYSNMYNNWMHMGLSEWTITSVINIIPYAFYVNNTGCIQEYSVYSDHFGIRPTFYLKSNVIITSGDGSKNSPYRVALG